MTDASSIEPGTALTLPTYTNFVRKPGAPTKYTEELAQLICLRITCGDSLAEICRTEGIPDYSTVMRWLQAHPDFRENYARAREDQGHADADEMKDISRRCLAGEIEPQAARAAIDALKWTAGKRLPKVYGDKLDVNVNGGRQTVPIDYTALSAEELAVLEKLLAKAQRPALEGQAKDITPRGSAKEGG